MQRTLPLWASATKKDAVRIRAASLLFFMGIAGVILLLIWTLWESKRQEATQETK